MIPAESQTFTFARVVAADDLPPSTPRMVDVALLDMNFEYPNLGHDSLVHTVGAIERELRPVLEEARLSLRVISFEVRKHAMLPEPPGGRFGVYIGTGGPGHIDPGLNDGQSPWCQRVREDAAWEPVAQRLFGAILADPEAAMLGICHSFGVICRWLGVARPTLRGPDKGGKSRGIQHNHLTDEACAHPWFQRFVGDLVDGRRATVADSRLFDLIPGGRSLPPGMTAIAHEVMPDGAPGEALTMLELARDRAGVMPRFFAVNHHPEINEAGLQQRLVAERIAAGGVSAEWCEERRRAIGNLLDPAVARRIELTARMTLLGPLRFHLHRQVRRRLERLGRSGPLHEDDMLARLEPA